MNITWFGRIGFLCKFRIVREQVAIRTQHRSTTAGIGNDKSVPLIGFRESFNVSSGKFARAFEIAGVRMKRAATDFRGRSLHRALVYLEHALSGLVDSSEKPVSHARPE